MSSPKKSIKIHEQCHVAPLPSSTQFSLPFTFFDLFWVKFHPVERIFFYSLPVSHSQPSFFFDKIVPNLKNSLTLTLQHFLPLAGNVVWPSDSEKPIIQFNPGDGISLVVAESDIDFNQILKHNSPREAIESRTLVPNLESSDSFASVISLQITLFPNSGFCIGISAHHAVLDGKSSTMFIKAWASICKSSEDSPSLVPKLEPFFDREMIKDTTGLGNIFVNNWKEFSSKFDSTSSNNPRSLKIMSDASFQSTVDNSFRTTIELRRGDLDKIKKRVLSKWDMVEEEAQPIDSPKPSTLSTFVLTCAYVSCCIAKACQESEKEKQKFALGFNVDCRARLEPPIPENYFGNCVSSHVVDTDPLDFTKEDGVVLVAKKIYGKIKMLDKGVLAGVDKLLSRVMCMVSEGIKGIGVAGSTRFGVYETDFGWGRPAKVEIVSIDRNLDIGMTESKDGKGDVEVQLVLNKHVMRLFCTIFHEGLCFE